MMPLPTLPAQEAPADALHAVLVNPPWTVTRRPAAPVVVTGLHVDLPAEARWAPGERERFAESDDPRFRPGRVIDDPATLTARVRAGQVGYGEDLDLLAFGPAEAALPVLVDWDPYLYAPDGWLPPIVARWGAAALPAVLRIARRDRAAAPTLMPLVSPEVATLMADWFTRMKSLRGLARTWLLRHPDAAARALIPAALGRPGPARLAAHTALRILDRATITQSARGYGPEAAAAIESILDTDPLTVLPTKIPQVEWADPETLPRVRLRDGSGVLPAASARHLLTMLAISRPGVYPGVPIARELLDTGDLAEFGWAVFRRWQQAGTPPADDWALTGLGLIGDDETVRRLSAVIRAWPGQNGHTKAVAGLEVLATIGTDTALIHLNGIARRVTFKGLKERARQTIAELADARGLTEEQLADRIVPDLGLSADGSLDLDGYLVRFDEQLRPYVTDPAGKRRKTAPSPRFAALKKDARVLAADQIARLERAMVEDRRWTGAEFGRFLVRHPLLWAVVHRLLWGAHHPDGTVRVFRVAEDRTFATLDDMALAVADDAVIGLPHPARTDLSGWGEVLDDYEIIQPFPQVAREVFSTGTEAFAGATVETARLLGLERRGWRRGDPFEGGVQIDITRPLPGRRTVALTMEPGIVIGDPTRFPVQKIDGPFVTEAPGDRHLPFGRLDPAIASEVIRDLRAVIG
ncbi:DUF4132 domain-containing protein [Catenuloplanes sp. NPDC051500]|uniref:DUF4132 domain-containing protein n=1 Tax=Catenuloplanes sp. NPDC051500 TaxID=3363959 RepID=UPI0037A6081F